MKKIENIEPEKVYKHTENHEYCLHKDCNPCPLFGQLLRDTEQMVMDKLEKEKNEKTNSNLVD
jgi:hypothetical protein